MFGVTLDDIVSLSRGDTIDIPLFINAGTDLCPVQYILNDDDKIYFALLEPHQKFENAILKKVYTKADEDENGIIHIKFKSSDTEKLLPGRYYYTVKLAAGEGDDLFVNTIIPECLFYIV